MDFTRLEQNIYAVIKEQQIKLGYAPNGFWLYYPLRSLNLLLGTDAGTSEMHGLLGAFAEQVRDTLGPIGVTNKSDRFCLRFEGTAAQYVHDTVPDEPFLVELIRTVGGGHESDEAAGHAHHAATMEQVLAVFHKYSNRVHVEEIDDEEFDALVYFEDGAPDGFRYCLADEMGHVTYHRFTAEEYQDRRR